MAPALISPVFFSLPISDRQTSFEFYRTGLGLVAIGEPAEDGVPEPLLFALNPTARLMLIPADGFAGVIGDYDVAQRGHSECFLGLQAETQTEVDEMFTRALEAGARIVTEPANQPWGYAGAFSDPDCHVWMVTSEPLPASDTAHQVAQSLPATSRSVPVDWPTS